MGSAQEVIDRIGEYADAGCVQVNLALRAPFDPTASTASAPRSSPPSR